MSRTWAIGICAGGCIVALAIVLMVWIDRGGFDPPATPLADKGVALVGSDSPVTPAEGTRPVAGAKEAEGVTAHAISLLASVGTLTGNETLSYTSAGQDLRSMPPVVPSNPGPSLHPTHLAPADGFSVWPQKP